MHHRTCLNLVIEILSCAPPSYELLDVEREFFLDLAPAALGTRCTGVKEAALSTPTGTSGDRGRMIQLAIHQNRRLFVFVDAQASGSFEKFRGQG